MNRPELAAVLKDYLVPSAPGRTLGEVLVAQADERVGALQLAPIIQQNPVYTQAILGQGFLSQKLVAWNEEDPQRPDKERVFAERFAGLFGKAVVRNLVASARLLRIAGAWPRKKNERPSIQPSSVIPLALAIEEECQSRKWVHSEKAFLGGLHYDWLSALLAARKGPKDAKAFLDLAAKEGRRMAEIAYQMSLQLKQVKHSKWIYAAAVVAPLGKGLMAIVYAKGKAEPNWAGFMAEAEKQGGNNKATYIELHERKRFTVTHAELTGLYVGSMGILSEVEPAIRFYLEPWRVKGDPDQYQLAMVLNVAAALARGPITAGKPLPLLPYQRKWLLGAGILEEQLGRDLAKLEAAR